VWSTLVYVFEACTQGTGIVSLIALFYLIFHTLKTLHSFIVTALIPHFLVLHTTQLLLLAVTTKRYRYCYEAFHFIKACHVSVANKCQILLLSIFYFSVLCLLWSQRRKGELLRTSMHKTKWWCCNEKCLRVVLDQNSSAKTCVETMYGIQSKTKKWRN
jgi:hypothetical protein